MHKQITETKANILDNALKVYLCMGKNGSELKASQNPGRSTANRSETLVRCLVPYCITIIFREELLFIQTSLSTRQHPNQRLLIE